MMILDMFIRNSNRKIEAVWGLPPFLYGVIGFPHRGYEQQDKSTPKEPRDLTLWLIGLIMYYYSIEEFRCTL
jgi:hypothetical protein